jgi:hypothetical protein
MTAEQNQLGVGAMAKSPGALSGHAEGREESGLCGRLRPFASLRVTEKSGWAMAGHALIYARFMAGAGGGGPGLAGGLGISWAGGKNRVKYIVTIGERGR